MIAVDTNILVYAHRRDSEFHAPAAALVRSLAEGVHAWSIAWPSVHEFFAIVTHPRIYRPPTPAERAISQIDAWLGSPSLVLLGETPKHWTNLRALIGEAKIEGPKVHDARIATFGERVEDFFTLTDGNGRALDAAAKDAVRAALARAFGASSNDSNGPPHASH